MTLPQRAAPVCPVCERGDRVLLLCPPCWLGLSKFAQLVLWTAWIDLQRGRVSPALFESVLRAIAFEALGFRVLDNPARW